MKQANVNLYIFSLISKTYVKSEPRGKSNIYVNHSCWRNPVGCYCKHILNPFTQPGHKHFFVVNCYLSWLDLIPLYITWISMVKSFPKSFNNNNISIFSFRTGYITEWILVKAKFNHRVLVFRFLNFTFLHWVVK